MTAATLSKRECVLVEAAKMFARFGFRKTSIDEIAREAGVGKGTVYLTADSKEELFYQVLLREVRGWQVACAKVIDPRVPADELLLRLYMAAHEQVSKNNLVRDLFRGEIVKILPSWGERLDELQAIGRVNLTEILHIGVRQGRFRKDLEVESVATILQDMHIAGWILRPAHLTDEVVHDRARVAFNMILHGILAPAQA